MPEEIMIIAVMGILAGTITSIIRMVLTHREKTMGVRKGESKRSQSSTGSSSLTTSELERMLHRVVRKATDPLNDRLDEIEDRLDAPATLPEAEERIALDEEYGARESAMAPARKRTR
jgi:hypothetical protein